MENFFVAGALYYDPESNMIIKPLYTQQAYYIDCVEYWSFKRWKESYNSYFRRENKDDYIDYGNERYYYAEAQVFRANNSVKLLSDLSGVAFFEENRTF